MKEKVETEQSEEYRCEHCKRNFVKPGNLLKHLCEQKRRWQDKDKPASRIAYEAWLKFYKTIQPFKKKKEYIDFISSAYYVGFVKFGLYCVEASVVDPLGYVNQLLKENTPLDNWNSDKVYTKYLILHLRSEDGMLAVKRSVDNMLTLSENENLQLRDVFKYVNINKLCYHIVNGKISPWMVYQSKTGVEFLSRLNDDQRNLIYPYIDPERWNIKFKRDNEETKMINSVIAQIEGL
jgi:hypothetical protein